jgi:hypothetical protein
MNTKEIEGRDADDRLRWRSWDTRGVLGEAKAVHTDHHSDDE